MTMFSSQAAAAVSSALGIGVDILDVFTEKKREDFHTLQTFYDGGPEMVNYLQQHAGERIDNFGSRKKRFGYPNYFGRLADEIAQGQAGGDIKITFPTASEKERAELQRIEEFNNFRDLRLRIATSIAVQGCAWPNVAYVKDFENICIHCPEPANIDFETHPDNPRHANLLSEMRKIPHPDRPKEKLETFWVWADGTFAPESHPDGFGIYVAEDGRILDERFTQGFEPGPYGALPYVCFHGRPGAGFEGKSYVRSQLTLAKTLLNALSDLGETVYRQGYGFLVTKGSLPPEQPQGQAVAMHLGADGEAFMLHPNAPIMDVKEFVSFLIDIMFQTGSVPVDIVKGAVTESGVALAIKWRPFSNLVQAARQRYEDAERQLWRVVCTIGRAHDMKLPDPEKMYGDDAPQLEWMEDIVPQDEAISRTQDQLDVTEKRLPVSKYMVRWQGSESEEAAMETLQQAIDEQNQLKQDGDQGEEGDRFSDDEMNAIFGTPALNGANEQ